MRARSSLLVSLCSRYAKRNPAANMMVIFSLISIGQRDIDTPDGLNKKCEHNCIGFDKGKA